MNTRAILGLAVSSLFIGLLGGLAIGGDGGTKTEKAGPGPNKTVAGVPVGYERSQAGAVSAALNYETALTAAGPSGYRTVLGAIAESSARDAITNSMQPGMDVISKQLGENALIRSAVVGYQVKSYNSSNAEVDLWEVGVVAATGQAAPQAGWTTTTVRVRWSDGDWRLAEAPMTKKGPTPQQPDDATEIGKFIESVKPLAGARYAAAP